MSKKYGEAVIKSVRLFEGLEPLSRVYGDCEITTALAFILLCK
jgi:hypothetical protein